MIATKNFKKGAKLHMCCSSDNLRVQLQCVYFKSGFAYATDGHILVKCKVDQISTMFTEDEIAILDGKFVHSKHYAMLLKYDNVDINHDGFVCKKRNQIYKVSLPFFSENDIDGWKYPNADAVIPSSSIKPEPVEKIGIKPSLILRLSSAIPSDIGFVFEFYGSNHAIKCTPLDVDLRDCIGIVMPYAINK